MSKKIKASAKKTVYEMTDDELKDRYLAMDPFARVLSYRKNLLWRLDDAISRMSMFIEQSLSKSKSIQNLRDGFRDLIWRRDDYGILLHTLRMSSSGPIRDHRVRTEVLPSIIKMREMLPETCPLRFKDAEKQQKHNMTYRDLLLEWDAAELAVFTDFRADPDDSCAIRDENVHSQLK